MTSLCNSTESVELVFPSYFVYEKWLSIFPWENAGQIYLYLIGKSSRKLVLSSWSFMIAKLKFLFPLCWGVELVTSTYGMVLY